MKKYYRISWNVDATPAHLVASVVFSLYVMFFINIFVGSMGGVPAFMGFLFVFYLLRAMVNAGSRISHTLAMTRKTEVIYLIINYSIIYLVIWGLMRLLLFLSVFSGWGNAKGLSAVEYIKALYGTTMLEKWAYLFAGILMYAFVMSLFPTVVLKGKKVIVYLIFDSAFFAIVCFGISMFAKLFIDNELESRATCVLDNLLLSRMPNNYWGMACIVFVILFTIIVSTIGFQLAVYQYSPKPGTKKAPEELMNYSRKEQKAKKQKLKKIIIASLMGLAVVAIVGVIYFFGPTDKKPNYKKVAECMTNDSNLGPMNYEGTLYVPSATELDFYETGKPVGYIGYKGQECTSRFYQLAISNILYKKHDDNQNVFLQMYGADVNTYEKLDIAEEMDEWKDDEVFLLWDEDWSSESTYTKDLTGYSECGEDLIKGLEEEFGEVKYDPKDFEEYDAYFTIVGYKDLSSAVETEDPKGHWVGCILVRDNNFYYGSYENRIVGVKLKALLEVIGGY